MIRALSIAPAFALLAGYLTGCQGQIGNTPDFGEGNVAGPSGRGAASSAAGGVNPVGQPLTLPPAGGMRRLTSDEYTHALRDLLGVSLEFTLDPDTRLDGFTKVGASRTAVSPLGIELYQKAAYQAIEALWADPVKRGAWVDCDPTAGLACARQVLTRFGRRAWRRPLTTVEVDRYANLAVHIGELLSDAQAGLENALAGVLQSPNFLYRLELGRADPQNSTRLVYPDHEIATRLSFFLINSTPDETLLGAADRGELASVDGIRAQAKRLLGSSAGHESIRGFARDLFNLPAVDTIPKDPALYPDFTPALRASMREEVERMWEGVAFAPGGSLLDVFTTRNTFVDDGLAALYGVTKPGQAGMVATTLPDSGARAGVLGTGGFLSVRAKINETTPTLRGRFVREVLLCQKVPDPPPNVNTNLTPPADGMAISKRQQLEQHRSSASCASCHSLMDPIGFGLENFDAIGRYRSTDRGLPIDASGNLDGAPFANARDLGQRLHDNASAHQCMMRNVYRYALGANEESGGEAWIPELEHEFDQSSQRFSDFVIAFVSSDLFRFATAKEGP